MTNENINISVILPILKQIPLFVGLDEDLHREIIEQIKLMFYPQNHLIFSEGDPGDALYIVRKGKILVFHPQKEEGDLEKEVAEIGENGFFGEMALISEVPRSASVKTLTDCEVFILTKENFNNLLSTNTNLAEQISTVMVARLNQNDQNELNKL